MSEYWVSQGRKMCTYCKCWTADNKASIAFHEQGKKHKEMVKLKLDELRKKGLEDARNKSAEADTMAAIERAAMESFKKDIGNKSGNDVAMAYGSVESIKSQMAPKAPKEDPQLLKSLPDSSSKTSPDDFEKHNCWQEVIDELQGYTYYWNPETNETSWTAPADATIVKAPISNTPSNNLATEADPANDSQVISEPDHRAPRRSASSAYGRWETVDRTPPTEIDLGLPNQPKFTQEETEPVDEEPEEPGELKTEDIPLPSDTTSSDIPPVDEETSASADVPRERNRFKTKTVALAPSKKDSDGAPKFKKPKFSGNRNRRQKKDDGDT